MWKVAVKARWWSGTARFASSVSKMLRRALLHWGFSSSSRQQLKWEKEPGLIRKDLNCGLIGTFHSLPETPHVFSLCGRNFRIGHHSPPNITLFWGIFPDCEEAEWFEKAWIYYAVLSRHCFLCLYIKRGCIWGGFSWAVQ